MSCCILCSSQAYAAVDVVDAACSRRRRRVVAADRAAEALHVLSWPAVSSAHDYNEVELDVTVLQVSTNEHCFVTRYWESVRPIAIF